MIIKALEIRDDGTTIPALAIDTSAGSPAQYGILRRSGFDGDGHAIIVMMLCDQKATCHPDEWPDLGCGRRTMPIAHRYIINHFDDLTEGDVVDVEFILGETTAPKAPECWPVEAQERSA